MKFLDLSIGKKTVLLTFILITMTIVMTFVSVYSYNKIEQAHRKALETSASNLAVSPENNPEIADANFNRIIKNSKSTLITISVICAAFALSITLYFSYAVSRSVAALIESIKIISRGNFFHKTKKLYNDEFGILADSLNEMTANLEKTTSNVNNLYKEIAERKTTEEMLTTANKQFEKSNKELLVTTKKLQEANQELKDFVYIASHDLREPLRKITSFGSLLKESVEAKLNDDEKESLKYMIDGAERMTKMIEGLLTYSRVGTKEIQFEEVDLNEIVHQLKQLELSKSIEESGGTVEVPQSLPKVWANPIQIRQLMQNLIGNGLKYHTKDAKPVVTVISKSISDDVIRIEVQDNGIGLDEKYYEDIFKMFRRLHSRTEYEGTGIGLAICKKIIDKHNGQIGVESKRGQGSTFWFTLPVNKQNQVLEEERQELVESLEK